MNCLATVAHELPLKRCSVQSELSDPASICYSHRHWTFFIHTQSARWETIQQVCSQPARLLSSRQFGVWFRVVLLLTNKNPHSFFFILVTIKTSLFHIFPHLFIIHDRSVHGSHAPADLSPARDPTVLPVNLIDRISLLGGLKERCAPNITKLFFMT